MNDFEKAKTDIFSHWNMGCRQLEVGDWAWTG